MKKIFTIGMAMMFLAVFAGMSFAQDNTVPYNKARHSRPPHQVKRGDISKLRPKFLAPSRLKHKPAGSNSAPVTVR